MTDPHDDDRVGEDPRVVSIDTQHLLAFAERADVPSDVRAYLTTTALVAESVGHIVAELAGKLAAEKEIGDHLYSIVQALVYEGGGQVYVPDVVVLTADPADVVTPKIDEGWRQGSVGRRLMLGNGVMHAWADRIRHHEDDETVEPAQYEALDTASIARAWAGGPVFMSREQVASLYPTWDKQSIELPDPPGAFVAGCDEGAVVTTADEAVAATLMAPDEVTIPDLLGNLAMSVEEARDARARHMTALCTCGKPRSMHHFVAGQGYVGPCLSPDPDNTCFAFELAVVPNPLGGQLVVGGEVVMAESYMPVDPGWDGKGAELLCNDPDCSFLPDLGFGHTLGNHADAGRRPEGQ